ncbi:hypothetical protein KBD49_04395 [Myxococcota bacterium]|nr:hypothetical protein [Myxococcota bacterium]
MNGIWRGIGRYTGLAICLVAGIACAGSAVPGEDGNSGDRGDLPAQDVAGDRGPEVPGEVSQDVPSRDGPGELPGVDSGFDDGAWDLPEDPAPGDAGGDLQGDPEGRVSLVAIDRLGEILAGTSAADGRAWLAGRNGLVVRSDGDDFWPFPGPSGAGDLTGVSVSDGTVFVTDARGSIHRWREREGWTRLREGDGASLNGIAAVSGEEFWAVGNGGRVFHGIDGEVLPDPTGITYDLFGVQASREGGVRAVGRYGTLLTRGAVAWERTTIGSSSVTLRAIWRGGDGRMVAVGDRGVVVRHDGISWKLDLTNETEDPPRDLYAVWGTASDDILAAGDGGALFRFDGKRWSREAVAGPGGVRLAIRAVATRRRGDGTWAWTAAGLDSLALDRVEGAWKDRVLGIATSIYGAETGPDGEVVAVGEQGLVLRWRPGESPWAVRAQVPGSLLAVSWPLAVGQRGALVRIDGGRTETLDSLGNSDLTGVKAGAGGAWITDDGGTLWRWSEAGSEVRATRPVPLWAVAESDGLLWVAGGDGRLEVDVGEGFRVVPTGTFSTIRALLPLPGGRVIAAGDFGLVIECDAAQCRRVYEDPGTFLFALGQNGGIPLAAGWAGTLVRRGSGGSWEALESGTRRVFRAAAGLPAGGAVLAGLDGTLGTLEAWGVGGP